MSRRLGVFGGTFDPIHDGHLAAAVNVRYALALDVVLLVVANEPWQKIGSRQITPARDRLALVEAAVRETPGLEACSLEIERGGPSYTADTLAELRATEPGAELFLILGTDAARGLQTWERVEEVVGRVRLVVLRRSGAGPPPERAGLLASSIVVEVPALRISSTELRARCAAGAPIDFLTPQAVQNEIAARCLYTGEP
jgi:nicotinate-nucleotide adenylyltransferase